MHPVAYFLKAAVEKFQKAAFRPNIQGLLEALEEALQVWGQSEQLPDSAIQR
jgi:hypothetical protein